MSEEPNPNGSSNDNQLKWIEEAQSHFNAAQYSHTADILQKRLKPPTGQGKSGKRQAASATHTSLLDDIIDPDEIFDASFYHNLVLATFLADGRVLSVPAKVIEKQTDQSAESSGSTSKQASKKAAASTPANEKSSSPLDASHYPPGSIESVFASLGHRNIISWYNLVVLQFTSGNYKQAAKTCEELIDRALTAFDGAVAIKLAFIYIFIQIKLCNIQHPKLATVFNFLEKTVITKLEEAKKANDVFAVEQYMEDIVWIHALKAQISLMQSKIKASKREIQTLSTAAASWNSLRSTLTNYDPSQEHAILALVALLKSRLLDVRKHQKKAEEEIQAEHSIYTLFRQAYLNNLGVLAFHRKKPAASLMYFTQAANCAAHRSGKSKKCPVASSDDFSAELAYNSGIQLLALKRYADAKKCFEYAASQSSVYLSNPLLWIRLAECCLQTYSQTKQNYLSRSNSVTMAKMAGGRVRLDNCLAPTRQVVHEAMQALPTNPENGEAASHLPKLPGEEHLQHIRYYLQQSLMLMESQPVPKISEQMPAQSWIALAYSSTTNSMQGGPQLAQQWIAQREFVIRVYCRVVLAWASLELRDYAAARDYANSARTAPLPDGSSSSSWLYTDSQYPLLGYLAILYEAEALLRLGSLAEAEELLQSTLESGELPGIDGKPESAKLQLMCNLATVYILKDNIEQAKQFADKVASLDPNYPAVHLLQLFIDLKSGSYDRCLETLSKRRIKDLRVSIKI